MSKAFTVNPDNSVSKWQPRNDFVLIRVVEVGKSAGGVVIPQIAEQGKQRVVIGVGPDVKGLEIGDVVLVIGTMGADAAPLPDERNTFVTKQANVALVHKKAE